MKNNNEIEKPAKTISKWSEFQKIEEAMSNKGPFAGWKGVYQIRMVTRAGEPIPIRRLLGDDSTGLMYIGKSNKAIETRIRRNVCNPLGYARIKDRVKDKLGEHCLQARAMILPDGETSHAEQTLLEEYRSRYGELPPLNKNVGRIGQNTSAV